jgi:hypothetical protein
MPRCCAGGTADSHVFSYNDGHLQLQVKPAFPQLPFDSNATTAYVHVALSGLISQYSVPYINPGKYGFFCSWVSPGVQSRLWV